MYIYAENEKSNELTDIFSTMNKLITLCALLGLSQALYAQRQDSIINQDWSFRLAHEVQKNKVEKVNLPHTWNSTDALAGKPDYKRGIGNYFKQLFVPDAWKGKRVFLKFEGANITTDVSVNGKWVGEHKGGYTAFLFELTDRLNYGKENELWVRVNNGEQTDVMPLLGDFNFYGGIYRDVHLMVTEAQCISPLDYASDGVYLRYPHIDKEKAQLETEVLLANNESQAVNREVEVVIREANRVVARNRKSVMIPAHATHYRVKLPLEIVRPRLWQGKTDPFLYGVEVRLLDEGVEQDAVRLKTGVRTYRVDADKGFFLNGKHLSLQGVCTHQERAEVGNARTKAHVEEDFALMTEMGVNAIRLAHYPYADLTYRMTDSLGMVVWTEIPFVGPGGYADKGFINKESFKENGKQQLRELICQRMNHPSIFFWGLFNELSSVGDDPTEYIRELNRLAHEEDPSRLTTAASNRYGETLNDITDVMAWNRYDGWYSNTPATLEKWVTEEHRRNPRRKIAISEYGAGASLNHQEEHVKQPVANSYWHPESWQTYFHIENWRIIHRHPFIWGSFVWNMFDFGAAHRTEGDRNGINDKGLVTHDRRHKKDAFYFYKANWTDTPVLYIADRRVDRRTDDKTMVRVFTNLKETTLYVNGKKVAKQRPDELHMVDFGQVKLSKGVNRIEVIGRTMKGEQHTDVCEWTLE